MRVQLRNAGAAHLLSVSMGPLEDVYCWFATKEGYGDVNF